MMLTQTDQQANFLALDALHKRSQWLKKFIGKKSSPKTVDGSIKRIAKGDVTANIFDRKKKSRR